ncbi:MAG: insulinase family protein [Merdibacter sp.]
MKRITNERYQETYYTETLENGLRVVLWHKPGYARSLFMMATPLGAMDLIQEDAQGNTYSYPAGIAHFLEHKMFGKQDQDVMNEFSRMGANVNAFTSYNETAYYFSTSGAIEALWICCWFCQQLDISDASVEGKGDHRIRAEHVSADERFPAADGNVSVTVSRASAEV